LNDDGDEIFHTPEAKPASHKMGTVLYSGGKAVGTWS